MRTFQHLSTPGPAARRGMIAPPSSTRFDALHVDAVAHLTRALLERPSSSSSPETSSAPGPGERSG